MKRTDLVRWLQTHECQPVSGQRRGKHEAWRNAASGETSFVPRHREIGVGVARKICRQLESRDSKAMIVGGIGSTRMPNPVAGEN